MAESYIPKRVVFSKSKQKEFILKAKIKLDLTWAEFAGLLNFSTRNLIDWKNEKISMPLPTVRLICKKTKSAFPTNVKIKGPYWYAAKGAKKGGLAMYKKYGSIGNPEIRKKKWQEWWEIEGKFKKKSITQPLPFKKPAFSQSLAEFVGIILGDGGISDRQITFTFHRTTDKEYGTYVSRLANKLFDVRVGVYKNKNYLADDYIISRSGLVDFCTEKLGLKKGNKIKNRVDIPEWIKKNKKFMIGCVRGLIDTDGSVYNHRYTVGNKTYTYKKLDFVSLSKPLAQSVYDFLKELGVNPGFHKNKDVKIENAAGLRKYFKIIGTHNPKHLKRYLD